jgi:hypothetical protein
VRDRKKEGKQREKERKQAREGERRGSHWWYSPTTATKDL